MGIVPYAGNPASFPASVGLIDDAALNPATAAALNVANQNNADRTAYLKARVGNRFLVDVQSSVHDTGDDSIYLDSPDLNATAGASDMLMSQQGLRDVGGGVSAVLATTPVTVVTQTPHGRAEGDVVYFSDLAAPVTALNLTCWQVHIVDGVTVQLVGSTSVGASLGGGGHMSVPNYVTFANHVAGDVYLLTAGLNLSPDIDCAVRFSLYIAEVPPGQAPAKGQPAGNLNPTKIAGSARRRPLSTGGGVIAAGGFDLTARYFSGLRSGYLAVFFALQVPGNPGLGVHRVRSFGDFTVTSQQFRSP